LEFGRRHFCVCDGSNWLVRFMKGLRANSCENQQAGENGENDE